MQDARVDRITVRRGQSASAFPALYGLAVSVVRVRSTHSAASPCISRRSYRELVLQANRDDLMTARLAVLALRGHPTELQVASLHGRVRDTQEYTV